MESSEEEGKASNSSLPTMPPVKGPKPDYSGGVKVMSMDEYQDEVGNYILSHLTDWLLFDFLILNCFKHPTFHNNNIFLKIKSNFTTYYNLKTFFKRVLFIQVNKIITANYRKEKK